MIAWKEGIDILKINIIRIKILQKLQPQFVIGKMRQSRIPAFGNFWRIDPEIFA